ncbi:CBS domain-containing protein [Pelagicoccus mobilis]|uniref:CBS domain-containing protein n=1 Tax=Pelagicoccus mobilis TaxID=415221 RepID=A0A934S3Z5_9BACT|nr:CBS domain-containing protein [Pelagicoccus mobilis]MBK1880276.1 CBS domain-containing protein [Pelagicoccus mobilis]
MQTAEDLMTKRFMRISTQHNLREALALLLYGDQQNAETAATVVIDTQGNFAGILTPECVVAGLSKNESTAHETAESLSSAIDENFPVTIDNVMKKGIPTVHRGTSLAELVKHMGQDKYECLPVCEEGRVEGIVYVSDIFKATATAALTADEGIVLE